MNPSVQALAALQDPEIQRLFQIYFSGGTKQRVSSDIPAPRGPSPGGGGVSGGGGGSGAPADLSALGAMLAEANGSTPRAVPPAGSPGPAGGAMPPGVPSYMPGQTTGPLGPMGVPDPTNPGAWDDQLGGQQTTGPAGPQGPAFNPMTLRGDTPPPGVGPPPAPSAGPQSLGAPVVPQWTPAPQASGDSGEMRLAALAQLLGLA